ncbi:aspartate/glutamate racemase family protein [Piscinibacter gummiphilus]|uniref:Hydantoin racemase n=1 Tax=Piscinibacter gummiphilus TaxID=946333 RepID=A0A1W6L2V1_9BURK|nr:aspartate/glutamate racemase family protein [Piscinibacter gummiphilus]ARN18516.1 hydantoin racemase [Piscinibacter gummiphilus]ATU63143.1 hydantoin racemase [Piscinibacter gummiphilus]GLS95461.1 hydantoin racemase [Piscinibacter gummiphilus]
MTSILLINPNTSEATTAMMVDIAAAEMPAGVTVFGSTARCGAPMIVDEADMAEAREEVARCWRRAGVGWDGVIVSAFGDPGLAEIRAMSPVPAVGICEASLMEAAEGGRRFGIATVTPDLVDLIEARIGELGLLAQYTGTRLTPGAPRELASDAGALEQALSREVAHCIDLDGAQAVVIGGGPLGQAARALQPRFHVPVIAPIPAAVRQLRARLGLTG